MATVSIVQGFSLTNRLLLYASVLLAPAQFASGLGNHCPSNIGFLAYNWYTQISWLRAAQGKNLHALCLAVPHFNLIYTLSYIGGISSGNVVMGAIMGIGTAGVLLLNDAVAWISWTTNQPEGFGIFHFFFYGWRTLSSGWHTFFLVWGIFDTFFTVAFAVMAVVGSFLIPSEADDCDGKPWAQWGRTLLCIPLGAAVALLIIWPLILWTELIVAHNHIESATDWIAVWLFCAQVGAMIVPSCAAWLGCLRGR